MIEALMVFFAVGTVGQPSSPALDSARKAALIQSGFQRTIDQAESFAEGKAKMYVQKAGAEGSVAAIGVVYKVYKDRAIQIREFRNPIIPGCRNYATIGVDQASIGFKWNF